MDRENPPGSGDGDWQYMQLGVVKSRIGNSAAVAGWRRWAWPAYYLPLGRWPIVGDGDGFSYNQVSFTKKNFIERMKMKKHIKQWTLFIDHTKYIQQENIENLQLKRQINWETA